MIRHTQQDIDAASIIAKYLVIPATVTSNGLTGKFDTLRVALEHLQTHGTEDTLLSFQGVREELQFSDDALSTLVKAFSVWLYQAGLPIPGDRGFQERLDDGHG